MSGILISFDGIDSSGKETQAKILLKRVEATGRPVGFFQTPDYTTNSGIKLKRLFQGQDGSWDNLAWPEKMRLIAANRSEHKNEVLSLLQQDGIVIYDRYVPSSIAHMMADALDAKPAEIDRHTIKTQVEDHEYGHHQMPHENLSIFLDLSPVQAASLLHIRKQRLGEADETTDRIDLQERIYQSYHWLVNTFPDRCTKIACVENNQLLTIDAIANKVWQSVTLRFSVLNNARPL
jgi:dTMP kinase